VTLIVCTALTCSATVGSVRNMRVRTTSASSAPAVARASVMISKQRRAWVAASAGQDPSGQTGPVPETRTQSPHRTAQENPMRASHGEPEETRRPRLGAAAKSARPQRSTWLPPAWNS
jgi:hypothetical protein